MSAWLKLLKPIRWRTFPRDFAVIQAGFALYGLSIAMLIRAHLGTSPWAVLEVALADLTGLSVGTLSILVGLVVLAGALALREQIGWGTVANILSIGLWLDFFLARLPDITDNLPVQAALLLGAVLVMGVASALYIGVEAGAGPRDSLMLAVQRTTGLSLRVSRGVTEVGVVAAGWLLGGPLGAGTLVFALLIGPAVQWAFRLFKMPTQAPQPASATD
ncbi:MAG: hypothetical protein KA764_16275 [Anaerolineales bacterium]|nr:hypothetical protein [Anaerolineales bacterium]